MVFEVGIGTSQEWDPERAIDDAVTQALSTLTDSPKFALLFSTIHYEKDKGFQRILNKVYAKIPQNTPLIGGTVAGFSNSKGCFTRGLTIALFNTDLVKPYVSIGENTKRNPTKAAEQYQQRLEKNIGNTKEKELNSILIISGGKVPYIPFLKQGRVITSNIIGEIVSKMTGLTLRFMQKGVAREEEILSHLKKIDPNSNFISLSAMDDERMDKNFVFYNNKVTSDVIVGLTLVGEMKFDINTEVSLNDTGLKFQVTKIGKDKRTLKELNNYPAKEEFIRRMGWPKDYFNENIYRKVFFYPITQIKDGQELPCVAGLFLGNNIYTTYQIESDEISIKSYSGNKVIESVENDMRKHDLNPLKFLFVVECGIRLEAMGRRVFKVKDKIEEFTLGKPFLLVYPAGEGTYINKVLRYGNETYNTFRIMEKR